MRIAIAVLALAVSGCNLRASISRAEQTQAAVAALAQANGMLTSTSAATTPTVHTRVPVPVTLAPGMAAGSGTPPPIPVTGATQTTIADCDHPLTTATPGPQATVLIHNKTNVPITFLMGLSALNFLGDCGYIAKAGISPGESTSVSVPWSNPPATGPCYWARAVLPTPHHTNTSMSEGGFCLVNAPRWLINVTDHGIRLVQP